MKREKPTHEPYSIDELRRDMHIKLSIPEGRKLLTALGKRSGMHELWKGELIALLTSGLQDATIVKPAFDPSRDAPRAGPR